MLVWPAQYCREHLGLHPCDRRRSLAYLRFQYPAVDFSLVSLTSCKMPSVAHKAPCNMIPRIAGRPTSWDALLQAATPPFPAERPTVVVPQIETEEDELWQEKSRENHDQIRARGRKFVAWLLARPERRLAVVTHSSFLFFLLSNYGHQAAAAVQGELHRWCALLLCLP